MRATALPALLVALALTSCRAERTLRFTSDPPGAAVTLDGEPVGTTPVTVEFQHYGTRRVVFRMPGHGTTSLRVTLAMPWYARFPMDIASEVLIPVGWEDEHTVHAVLVEGEEAISLPTLRSVLDRAEALRRAGPRGPGELPPILPAGPAAPEPEASGEEQRPR